MIVCICLKSISSVALYLPTTHPQQPCPSAVTVLLLLAMFWVLFLGTSLGATGCVLCLLSPIFCIFIFLCDIVCLHLGEVELFDLTLHLGEDEFNFAMGLVDGLLHSL